MKMEERREHEERKKLRVLEEFYKRLLESYSTKAKRESWISAS